MSNTQHADELRRQAEERLAARHNRIETLERTDLVSLAHELAVHQMELEIQNDELRRTQLEAQDARDRYLDLYDFAPVGYYTLDEHSRIVEANLTGCRLLSEERQDVLKTRFTKFLREEDTDKFYFHRKAVLEGGVRQTCELKMQKADGAAFDARLESIKSDEGRLRVAVIDVTERKRAEEALRVLNATLESKVAQRTVELRHRARQLQKLTLDMSQAEDRERRRLAEILHNDLQQVLAAAKFHVGLIRNRAKYDSSLQAAAVRVDHMLKNAIEKSRSLSHELSPAVMPHADFAETLRWLAHEVQAKHGLVVHVHARGEVHSSSEALKAFLYRTAQELLFNVVKHARVNEARLQLRRLGRCICLSVSDQGRGFDPQTLGESAGYGLLSIRERIALLGGRMRIKSAKDKGSTFFIVVPDGEIVGTDSEVDVRSSSRVREAGHAADEDSGRLRVLLADDHEIVRQGLVSLLSEEHTIEVVGEAANGREAVELAARLEPDVVVMDVAMPLIDGAEATRQIKSQLPSTRVVALSMFEDPDTVERMHAAGAEAYVLKTAPSEELLAAIQNRQTAEA